MKTYSLVVLMLLVCRVSQAQEDSISNSSYSSALGIGEQLRFGDKSVKFKKLISDSRCPEGVTCVWAGEAKILVEVFEKGISLGEIIIVAGANGPDISLDNFFEEDAYHFSSLQLKPYPEISKKLEASDYLLDVEITGG